MSNRSISVRASLTALLAGTLLIGTTIATAAGGSVQRHVGTVAHLALNPPRDFVGQLVVGDIHSSTLAAGAGIRRLTINWGDHSRPVTVSRLASKPAHRYAHPGRFLVAETLVDNHGRSARASALEIIARPQHVYWDLFDGQPGNQFQLESAALPLAAKSRATVISGTPENKLQCTSGMAVDVKGRLWVLSYPNGCSTPFSAAIEVFALPVTQSSSPVLTFTLPGVGGDDNFALDHHGNLWVEDTYHSEVNEFTGPFTTSGALTPSVTLTIGLNRPRGIAVDARGDVYVANGASTGKNSITVYHAPVTSVTVPTFLNGLTTPAGLAFDSSGDLFASSNPADGRGTALVRYNRTNLGNGAKPNILDSAGLRNMPYEANLAWDTLGNLYYADCGNDASLKVYPLATTSFSSSLRPSVVYANASLSTIGCAWGIGIH